MLFLADQFNSGLQYRSINSLRLTISMTHNNIGGTAVGRHPLVSCRMFNRCPPSSRYSHSWDVRIVINFLSSYSHPIYQCCNLQRRQSLYLFWPMLTGSRTWLHWIEITLIGQQQVLSLQLFDLLKRENLVRLGRYLSCIEGQQCSVPCNSSSSLH